LALIITEVELIEINSGDSVLFRKTALNYLKRAIISEACCVQVLNSSKGRSLKECILNSSTTIEVSIKFTLGIVDAWDLMHVRNIKMLMSRHQ
jgi:hypothetical protein